MQFQGIQQANSYNAFPAAKKNTAGQFSYSRFDAKSDEVTFGNTKEAQPVKFGKTWLGTARKGFGALTKGEANRKALTGVFLAYVLPFLLMAACVAIPVIGWCCAVPMGFLVVPGLAKWGDKKITRAEGMGSPVAKLIKSGSMFAAPHEKGNEGNPVEKGKEAIDDFADNALKEIKDNDPNAKQHKDNINKARKFFTIDPESKLGKGIEKFTKLKRDHLNRSGFAKGMAKFSKWLRKYPLTRFIGLFFTAVGSLFFFLRNRRAIVSAYKGVKGAKNWK